MMAALVLCTAAIPSQRKFMVTGATDGIGRFTARQLAKDGHHVRQQLAARLAAVLAPADA